jgi:hypothetical protein
MGISVLANESMFVLREELNRRGFFTVPVARRAGVRTHTEVIGEPGWEVSETIELPTSDRYLYIDALSERWFKPAISHLVNRIENLTPCRHLAFIEPALPDMSDPITKESVLAAFVVVETQAGQALKCVALKASRPEDTCLVVTVEFHEGRKAA